MTRIPVPGGRPAMDLGRPLAIVLCALLLAGCDPGVHIAWQKQFEGPVDADCIEQALRTVVPDVRRGSYVSDRERPRGFPSGTKVTQFNYNDRTYTGAYSLDIALLPNGRTNLYHGWGKIGTDIDPEERSRVVPLLNSANAAVERRCGLSFEDSELKQGEG